MQVEVTMERLVSKWERPATWASHFV